MKQLIYRLGQAGLCLALLMISADPALAAGFSVNPSRVSLSAAHPVSSLRVTNQSSKAIVIHLELLAWSREAGKDVYVPTEELLATPPIFTVPASGTQLVRVGLRRAADSQRELTYRVFLQEVPPPPEPNFQGLQIALRIGVPVFVAPVVGTHPLLRWRAIKTATGQITVSIINDGNAHVKVAEAKLMRAGSADPLAKEQITEYVFPGESRNWAVKTDADLPIGTPLHISTQTDIHAANRTMEADIILEKP